MRYGRDQTKTKRSQQPGVVRRGTKGYGFESISRKGLSNWVRMSDLSDQHRPFLVYKLPYMTYDLTSLSLQEGSWFLGCRQSGIGTLISKVVFYCYNGLDLTEKSFPSVGFPSSWEQAHCVEKRLRSCNLFLIFLVFSNLLWLFC